MAEAYVSTVIEAPIEAVWAVVRDFQGLAGWMPGILGCKIEDGRSADSVGAVRVLKVGEDAPRVREKLLALSDSEHACTYALVEGPLPVAALVATIRLSPVTDSGATFGEWSAQFEPRPGKEVDAAKLIPRVFAAGWRGLRAKLAPAAPSP